MAKASKPNPPDWLDDAGQAKWHELLDRMPDFNPDDADTLALLCASWQNFLLAQRDIRDNGQTLMGEKGRAFINPAVNVLNEERKSILKLFKLFGLSPDAKARAAPGDGVFSKMIDGQG